MSEFRDKREQGVDNLMQKYAPFINARPMLLSLLYDVDMLPEQTVTLAGAARVVAICEVWRKGENGELPPPPSTSTLPASAMEDGRG